DGVAQLGPDAGQDKPVVVHEEHAGPLGGVGPSARVGHRGITSSTSVPSSGWLRIAALPPLRSMRPMIESAMPRRSEGTWSGSNPQPRSRTKTLTWSGSTSRKVDTAVAPEWRAALLSASRVDW